MRRKRGFSYIEALVSLFLIIIAGLVVFSVVPAGRAGLQASENRVNAARLGNSILNESRQKVFAEILPFNGNYKYDGVYNGVSVAKNYTYQVNVDNVNNETKRIWVVVRWTEKTGDKSLIVETIRTQSSGN